MEEGGRERGGRREGGRRREKREEGGEENRMGMGRWEGGRRGIKCREEGNEKSDVCMYALLIFRWSHDGKYFGRIGQNLLSIYEVPVSMYMYF